MNNRGRAGGRSGKGPRIGGHKKGGWQRDRGGSANPSSFQPVNHSRKTNRTHQKQTRFAPGFLDVKGCQTVEDLILLASKHGTLTTSNLSAFWSRFPHLMHSKGHADQREQPELQHHLESILATTVKAIDRFGEREVATTALGLAKVVSRLRSIGNDRVVGARPTLFQPLLAMCNVEAKGNTFQLLANRASSISDFNAQALSNLAYAHALVEYQPAFNGGRTLFDDIASEASDRLGAFNSQNLANMVWSYAKVQASHPRLFEQVADTVLKRNLRTFDPQAVSNIVWAFSTAGETSPKLFQAVGDHLVRTDLSSFKPQELSNILWAFATAGEASRTPFEVVGDHLVRTDLSAFNPQALANIIWAYSKAKQVNPRLYKIIADSIVARNLERFNSQGLSNIVWAFASAGMHHPKLFDKVAGAVIAKRNEFNVQAVANTLWAFAVTGRTPDGLFTSFASQAIAPLGEYETQAIAIVAWAFAVANVAAPDLFGERFIDAVCEKDCAFNTEGLSQLHQWNLWQQELGLHTLLPEGFQERCRDAFVSDTILTSSFQNDVVRELSAIGLSPEEEVLMPSGYRLDVLAEVRGHSVGIEVDGPYHFIARKPTGKTIIKRRQVASIDGVQIVSVPYWEWNKLGTRSEERQKYLARNLGMN